MPPVFSIHSVILGIRIFGDKIYMTSIDGVISSLSIPTAINSKSPFIKMPQNIIEFIDFAPSLLLTTKQTVQDRYYQSVYVVNNKL